ncbi:GntR family transcriptional regulator [Curtobacterium sp. VKM Ac-2922]|uniref:GntR family transcriptional regulator n=1 Tax=Curtobacterium sp. VKM Ac-2922 TaxID=2929475 RepID=UPI001FB1EBFC|nr:GntR family transcriptional regulator [Curtobacterium sp. VKM Ac-2922]MCJ1714222.1 GntR family transcriptional regulator [Curtobacterium sp. VKM Ac-2922]
MGFGEGLATAVVGPRERDGLGVPRSLLRDAVFLRLLERILRGEYRRGQRLRLDALADDMRVSRTPVREALVPLESLRLVSVQRYVGVVIAHWSIEQMKERIRLGCSLLVEPTTSVGATTERFDPAWLRDCLSEAGAFVELAAWLLRRTGSSVCADLLAAQRPVLDVFYTDDVALANGIDAVVDRRQRLDLVDRARDAAVQDDLVLCRRLVRELGECLIALPDRFRTVESA